MSARVPSYRLHKPSGRAVVTLSGRDYYLGAHNSESSKAEYNRLVAEWLASAGGNSVPRVGDKSINEMLVLYVQHCDAYYRDPTGRPTREATAVRAAMRPLMNLYGHTRIRDFGPLALKACRQAMIDSKRLCRNEVNKRTQHIVRCFKWATENELADVAVWQALKSVGGLRRHRTPGLRETDPILPVELDRIEATLRHVPKTIAAMARFQLYTGARPGEVCQLRPCDVDRTGDVWLFKPRTHKTAHHGHQRRIYIGPRGQAILQPWLDGAASPMEHVWSPRKTIADKYAALAARRKTPLSCGNRPGSNRKEQPKKAPAKKYTTASYAKAIANGCETAWPHPVMPKVPRAQRKLLTPEQRADRREWRRDHSWHPHQIRHASATMLRREIGLEAARVVLGHRSAAVAEVYAEIDWAKAENAMRRFG